MKNSLVLVTGATGSLGPRVVYALSNAGYRVRIISRGREKVRMPMGVESVVGDITDDGVVTSAVKGAQAVIHLAALLHKIENNPELRKDYERINVEGTKNVVSACLRTGVKRIVFFSTISVYRCSDRQIIREGSPTQGGTFYAKTKLDAEKIVLNAIGDDGRPRGVVLRLGAVYGSRIKGNYRSLVLGLARGRFTPVGKGSNRRTVIYDKDAADAAVLAMEHPAAGGKIFNVSDGRFHSVAEIISVMCQALGKRPPPMCIPVTVAKCLVQAWDFTAGLIGRNGIMAARLNKYLEDIAVSSECIKEELGFVPKYDLGTGWREAIIEMKRDGIL